MRIIYLISVLIIVASCSSKKKDYDNSNSEIQENQTSTKISDIDDEEKVITSILKEKNTLYLNGIYEYKYPHNTDDLIENHYIAFIKSGDSTEGWYYGTSDEFDTAREGYLPGFFVSKINSLKSKGDSLFFSVVTDYRKCYSSPFPIGYINDDLILKSNEIWNKYNSPQTLQYSGELKGLTITILVNGDTRVYKKRKNSFHIGIDNFDKSKCQSEPLIAIVDSIEDLNESLVLNFLSTFSILCENNVEFSQWSNELLFKILDKAPDLFVKTLDENAYRLDTTSILKELEAPIHDLIDINLIIEKIDAVNSDDDIKNEIIKRLKNI